MDITPGPWSEDAIWELLKFCRKNSGPWDEVIKESDNMPDEEDAPIISLVPEMLETIKQAVEWMDSWRYYGGDPYYSDDWHEKMTDILKRIEK